MTAKLKDMSEENPPANIKLSFLERISWKTGILNESILAEDLTNRFRIAGHNILRLHPAIGLPLLVKTQDVQPSLLLGILTGAIDRACYTLADKSIRPYDQVLEIGSNSGLTAVRISIKHAPLGYDMMMTHDENSAGLTSMITLNNLKLHSIYGPPEDGWERLYTHPFTTLILRSDALAVGLPEYPLPLSLRQIMIDTSGITFTSAQKIIKSFALQHFIVNRRYGKMTRLIRKRN